MAHLSPCPEVDPDADAAVADPAGDLVVADISVGVLGQLGWTGIGGDRVDQPPNRGGGVRRVGQRRGPDRAALLRSIIDRGFRLFDAFLDERGGRIPDPRRRLAALSRAYVEFADTHPGVYRVVFSAAGSGPAELGVIEGEAHPGRASLDAFIVAVSACTADNTDPYPTALRLWCFLHGLADLRLTKPELDWPAPQHLISATLADLGLGTGK